MISISRRCSHVQKLPIFIDTAESLTPQSQAHCQLVSLVSQSRAQQCLRLHEVKIMSLLFKNVFTSVKGGSFDNVFYVQDTFFTSNKC